MEEKKKVRKNLNLNQKVQAALMTGGKKIIKQKRTEVNLHQRIKNKIQVKKAKKVMKVLRVVKVKILIKSLHLMKVDQVSNLIVILQGQ